MNYTKISIIVLLIVSSIPSFGQLNIGIKVSPGFSPIRANTLTDTLTVEKDGSGIRILAGLVIDYEFRPNYELRSGINFVSKKIAYTGTGDTPGVNYDDIFTAQYVQLPISIKLNTDEIALDKKIYFQLGASLDFKVQDDVGTGEDKMISKLGWFDTSMIVAAGLDMKLGTKTRAFGGIVFQRGFLNQARDTVALKEKFTVQTGFIGLEAGIIF